MQRKFIVFTLSNEEKRLAIRDVATELVEELDGCVTRSTGKGMACLSDAVSSCRAFKRLVHKTKSALPLLPRHCSHSIHLMNFKLGFTVSLLRIVA